MLTGLAKPELLDERLLVGYQESDDASVYQISEDVAIIQTLDFFPPMVEDPYLFGKIAATNSLSDIYAMGGKPVTALNIVSYPQDQDLTSLGEILRGGNEVVLEAGATLTGGHSIYGDQVLYGLSAMGLVHPKKILTNNKPQEKDYLVLTKPLGNGILVTAKRKQKASSEEMDRAYHFMLQLNQEGADFSAMEGVHTMTDVTGFGLGGHTLEMVGTDYQAIISFSKLPLLDNVLSYAQAGFTSGGGSRNEKFVGGRICFENGLDGTSSILFDPQTSGGLLLSVSPDALDQVTKILTDRGRTYGVIGRIARRPADGPSIRVVE